MVSTYFDKLDETYTFSDHTFQSLFFCFKIPDEYYKGSYFMKFHVEAGQRPEDVSELVYGTQDYWWLILLYNKVENPFFDGQLGWPMSEDQIEEYSIKQAIYTYGQNYTDANLQTVSDEIFLLNEDLRQIKLPHPEVIPDMIQMFLNQIKNLG